MYYYYYYQILPVDTLEIHYYFQDDSHSMDAIVKNNCERELLYIIKEISKLKNTEIIIETEPIANGGIRQWFKILKKEENEKAPITSALIIALAISTLANPTGKVAEKIIEKLFEDPETIELQNELLKIQKEKSLIELEKLKIEKAKLEIDSNMIDDSLIISKKKSNFYHELSKYPKVTKISFTGTDSSKESKPYRVEVNSTNFNDFIIKSDELQPIYKESIDIELISPVLKKGKYKWMGLYNGDAINFSMQSDEFKELVQNGDIEFTNGSTINCSMEIKRKIDNEGIEKTIGYNVVRVNHYYKNNKPVETKEGKQFRQIREAESAQLKLF